MPDAAPLLPAPERLADWGPRYTETPPDPFSPSAPSVAEPWNTVTAAFFVVIALYWAAKLARDWRRYPFVCAGLPVLFAGGIGGTLYHATRTHKAYFLLDVIPISLLGVAGAVYLTLRLGRTLGAARVVGVAAVVVLAYLAVNGVVLRLIAFDSPNLRINLSYASLALLVLLPVGGVLVRTRFRHGAWVGVALGSFAVAWLCRLVDNTGLSTLPMGTHWLWHVFGAITTQAMVAYFVAVEGGELALNAPSGSRGPRR
jgi:hypothetical protein